MRYHQNTNGGILYGPPVNFTLEIVMSFNEGDFP
ncbi:unnamed protein product, partial [Rotaria magnacalcarata]